MKNLFSVSLIVFIVILLTSCHGVRPDAGEEAVIIKKPWFFGHGGISEIPITTGLTWCVWSTSSAVFNLKPVKLTETFDDLITSDNVPVDFAVYFTSQVTEGSTPRLYEFFGAEWYENNLKEPLRTLVRNYAKQKKLFDLTSNSETLDEGELYINTEIQKVIASLNIPIEKSKITIGKISPPKEVIKETIYTAAQKQKVKTNNERTKAELAREASEIASATADKAYMRKFGMTTSQYLKSRELDIKEMQIKLAENKKDVTLIFNQGAVPMLPIK